MSRILTGIQSSGKPHLGNLLGAIQPAIELSQSPQNQSFLFIADFHALTTIKDPKTLENNVLSVAAAWIACGFDTDKQYMYRQSRVPVVCELAWYLNCFAPFPMLANAHSFKEKSDRLSDVNAGLFTYPILMAADILLYDAEIVPVGKDQKQHLEITRDIAVSINNKYGQIFVVPESKIDENVMTIPGIDGRKMSKSYGNTLDVFQLDRELRKNVMAIVTDSTPLDQPKNPDTCHVFSLYSLLATSEKTAEMRENYLRGNYGFGHAKQALYEEILEKYGKIRDTYFSLIENPSQLNEELEKGEEKAKIIANETMYRVRQALGFR